VQETLFILGLALFLLGLLTGLGVPAFKNPRMGVASHLQGMTNGPFLVLVGLLWPHIGLADVAGAITVALLIYGTYANWLATQLGAVWGAGYRFAPIATGEHRGSSIQERIVDVLLFTLALAMIAATVLLIIGILLD
jgi:hydroxylaminobenzene mutase